jgi:hypothetical protein
MQATWQTRRCGSTQGGVGSRCGTGPLKHEKTICPSRLGRCTLDTALLGSSGPPHEFLDLVFNLDATLGWRI